MDGLMNEYLYGLMYEWMNRLNDCNIKNMHRCANICDWTDGWIDGWIDRWINNWIDGQMS